MAPKAHHQGQNGDPGPLSRMSIGGRYGEVHRWWTIFSKAGQVIKSGWVACLQVCLSEIGELAFHWITRPAKGSKSGVWGNMDASRSAKPGRGATTMRCMDLHTLQPNGEMRTEMGLKWKTKTKAPGGHHQGNSIVRGDCTILKQKKSLFDGLLTRKSLVLIREYFDIYEDAI